MAQPEQLARESINRLLSAAGWHVCDAAAANTHAARGVAIREFPPPGHGFADYLLYVDGKAAGVIEAKKEGSTLSGVETLSVLSKSFRVDRAPPFQFVDQLRVSCELDP